MKPSCWAATFLAFWTPLAFGTTWAFAGEPKLVDEKQIFTGPAPAYRTPTQFHCFSMRLSPDTKHLLYGRFKGQPELTPQGAPQWDKLQTEMVLRDLGSGDEKVLPIEPLEYGWRTVFTRFNLFDPAGRRLILANISVEHVKIDENASSTRSLMKLVLYDITTGKLTPTTLEGAQCLAKFDRTGKGLIGVRGIIEKRGFELFTAEIPPAKMEPLKVEGFIQSVCPTEDVICVWSPPERVRSPNPNEPPSRGPQRLFLYDLKAQKEVADIPINQNNGGLDDWETQWTADGRFLYYYDVRETSTDTPNGPRQRTMPIARVWDRAAGKPAGEIPDAMPVGPGPGSTTMLLANSTDSGFILHDAKTNKTYWPGDSSMKLIHAWGPKVVYAKSTPDGQETPCLATIEYKPDDAGEVPPPRVPTTGPATVRPGSPQATQPGSSQSQEAGADSHLFESTDEAKELILPDPALLDMQALKTVGLADCALQNARLVNALADAMRQHDEDLQRPPGVTPELNADLAAIYALRQGEKTPFDQVEAKAAGLLAHYTAVKEQGRICAAIAEIYGNAGSSPPTIDWAKKALKFPLDPRARLLMYLRWGDAAYLKDWKAMRNGALEARRGIALPYLLGLREAMRYDLPESAPELPGVGAYASDPPDPKMQRDHRLQVQTRVVAEFTRDMVTRRDDFIGQLASLNILAPKEAAEQVRRGLMDAPNLDLLLKTMERGDDVTATMAHILKRQPDSHLAPFPATAPAASD